MLLTNVKQSRRQRRKLLLVKAVEALGFFNTCSNRYEGFDVSDFFALDGSDKWWEWEG